MFKASSLFAVGIAICTLQPMASNARELLFHAHVESGQPTRIRMSHVSAQGYQPVNRAACAPCFGLDLSTWPGTGTLPYGYPS